MHMFSSFSICCFTTYLFSTTFSSTTDVYVGSLHDAYLLSVFFMSCFTCINGIPAFGLTVSTIADNDRCCCLHQQMCEQMARPCGVAGFSPGLRGPTRPCKVIARLVHSCQSSASLAILHQPCNSLQRWSTPRLSSSSTLGGRSVHHTRRCQQACPKPRTDPFPRG